VDILFPKLTPTARYLAVAELRGSTFKDPDGY